MKDYVNLKELCEVLSISEATGRNWIRLGKLCPDYYLEMNPVFEKRTVDALYASLSAQESTALKKRRNKNFISGNSVYRAYISEQSGGNEAVQQAVLLAEKYTEELTDAEIGVFLAEAAVQQFSACYQKKEGHLAEFLQGKLSFGKLDPLLQDLLPLPEKALGILAKFEGLDAIKFQDESQEDLLGFLYLSCRNAGHRKLSGAYYTPQNIIDRLICGLDAKKLAEESHILDPSCGTGNFLLRLPMEVKVENIFGGDIDPVAVKLTRINLALKYQIQDPEILYRNIQEQDYLRASGQDKYDFIIGNPPWGYVFTEEDKKYFKGHYQTASASPESYDLFLEKAIGDLKKGGTVSMVLPEAILFVKRHQKIREQMMQQCRLCRIGFLGDVFDKVQCPSIILQMEQADEAFSVKGLWIENEKEAFQIKKERAVTSRIFNLNMSDETYEILQKMENPVGKVYLKGQAEFALGIVTGDNASYLSEEKSEDNEMVIKGSQIERYRMKQAKTYLKFEYEKFQQCAPERMYRAPKKLLYRFIGRELKFIYDDQQTLSLNSCNILIPQIPHLEMKYVLALLNSKPVQYYYQNQYNSMKVLRSYLETLPLPEADPKTRKVIVQLTEALQKETESEQFEKLYAQLDKKIAALYHLTADEYERVCRATK